MNSPTPASAPDDDPDKTVIRVPAARRGFGQHVLPRGMRIEGLEITDLIGEGGFGIVYRAYDSTLEREVAVKEYLPASLAMRANDSLDVTVRSENHRETFEAGLKSFVNEARLLARFDHPSLLKVFRFWQANSTAYMAMPFYEGPTLKAHLKTLGRAPDERQLREWLRPLLDALSVMHKENCFHRDIAPDNILLTERGPLLLDFGAARRVIGDMTQALTVVLKPGYAPIEQYGETASMAQGAWTDLYALASVVHYAVTGRAPIASVERMMGAEMRSLSEAAAGRYRPEFLAGIDIALSLRPQDRPQNVAQFRELLDRGLPDDSPERFVPTGFGVSGFGTSGFTPSGFDDVPRSIHYDDPEPTSDKSPTTWPRTTEPRRTTAPTGVPGPMPVPPTPPVPAPARRGVLPVALAVGTLTLLGGALWWVGTQRGTGEAAPTAGASAVPAPVVAASAPLPVAPEPPPPVVAAPAPAPVAVVPAVAAPAPAPAVVAGPAPAPRPPVASPAPRREAAEPAPPPRSAARPERCSDILQKASLEALDAEETAFLRSQCR
jgi:serine/threonine protein kinase